MRPERLYIFAVADVCLGEQILNDRGGEACGAQGVQRGNRLFIAAESLEADGQIYAGGSRGRRAGRLRCEEMRDGLLQKPLAREVCA